MALPIQVFAEVLRPTTARVLGRWDRDYLRELPAATERQTGKGKAVSLEDVRDHLGRIMDEKSYIVPKSIGDEMRVIAKDLMG